ncbi:MAG TPA: peptidoglycan-binding protein, partial [Bacillota bacterium]
DLFSSTFQRGGRHEKIMTLKESLNQLGFGEIKVTTYYGDFTEKRVKDFQKYYGLTVTGKADLDTLDKIEELKSTPFQRGKRHEDTIQLKKDLNRLGFGNIKVTPLYGSFTETRVKDFQRYYGLTVTGVADSRTLDKIAEILSTPFQRGKRHEDTIQLKKDLNRLGFGNIKVTPLYGSFTETRVKDFQRYYGLTVTGIADSRTLDKIDEILSSPLQKGKRHEDTIQLKENLNQLGFDGIKVTTYYGDFTEKRVEEFQQAYELPVSGIADEVTLATIDELLQSREEVTYTNYRYTLEEALDIQMNQLQQTDMYRNAPAYVHSAYIQLTSSNNGKTTSRLNVRAEPNNTSHIYGTLNEGASVTILEKGNTWYKIQYNTWRNPTRSDVRYYLDPSNNDRFQHLVLTASAGVPASELNTVLKGKGVLEGLGQAFIDGGKEHSVNEIYLISHALLETGHGTSTLAKGVEVGKDQNGHLVLVHSTNRDNVTDIKTTYNMFGIGAVDSNPLRGGAFRAYNEGWFTPEAAIKGGAKFIASSYIHNQYKQNTLYKMRWNPANPGYPQYATDIAWAVKQVTQIKNMYSLLNNPMLRFNIPNYK